MKPRGIILAFTFMYIFPELKTEDEIAPGEKIEFTDEDIEIVVSSHNQLRAQNITPTASDMREISWDPSLAHFAQDWSANCAYSFKENTTTELWSSVGQSFFLATAAWQVDFHYSSVMKWLGQSSLFNYENGSCTDFCGHYLQLAYAETYKIGCAASFCHEVSAAGSDRKIENATFYMCAYYPEASPDGGYQPYKAGEACTNCTDPTDTCSKDLCASSQRLKPLTKPEKIPDAGGEDGGGFSFTQGWSMLEKALAGASGGAAVLGIIAAVIKMCKGNPVGPSTSPAPPEEVEEEANVTNGKAPTNPVEGES